MHEFPPTPDQSPFNPTSYLDSKASATPSPLDLIGSLELSDSGKDSLLSSVPSELTQYQPEVQLAVAEDLTLHHCLKLSQDSDQSDYTRSQSRRQIRRLAIAHTDTDIYGYLKTVTADGKTRAAGPQSISDRKGLTGSQKDILKLVNRLNLDGNDLPDLTSLSIQRLRQVANHVQATIDSCQTGKKVDSKIRNRLKEARSWPNSKPDIRQFIKDFQEISKSPPKNGLIAAKKLKLGLLTGSPKAYWEKLKAARREDPKIKQAPMDDQLKHAFDLAIEMTQAKAKTSKSSSIRKSARSRTRYLTALHPNTLAAIHRVSQDHRPLKAGSILISERRSLSQKDKNQLIVTAKVTNHLSGITPLDRMSSKNLKQLTDKKTTLPPPEPEPTQDPNLSTPEPETSSPQQEWGSIPVEENSVTVTRDSSDRVVPTHYNGSELKRISGGVYEVHGQDLILKERVGAEELDMWEYIPEARDSLAPITALATSDQAPNSRFIVFQKMWTSNAIESLETPDSEYLTIMDKNVTSTQAIQIIKARSLIKDPGHKNYNGKGGNFGREFSNGNIVCLDYGAPTEKAKLLINQRKEIWNNYPDHQWNSTTETLQHIDQTKNTLNLVPLPGTKLEIDGQEITDPTDISLDQDHTIITYDPFTNIPTITSYSAANQEFTPAEIIEIAELETRKKINGACYRLGDQHYWYDFEKQSLTDLPLNSVVNNVYTDKPLAVLTQDNEQSSIVPLSSQYIALSDGRPSELFSINDKLHEFSNGIAQLVSGKFYETKYDLTRIQDGVLEKYSIKSLWSADQITGKRIVYQKDQNRQEVYYYWDKDQNEISPISIGAYIQVEELSRLRTYTTTEEGALNELTYNIIPKPDIKDLSPEDKKQQAQSLRNQTLARITKLASNHQLEESQLQTLNQHLEDIWTKIITGFQKDDWSATELSSSSENLARLKQLIHQSDLQAAADVLYKVLPTISSRFFTTNRDLVDFGYNREYLETFSESTIDYLYHFADIELEASELEQAEESLVSAESFAKNDLTEQFANWIIEHESDLYSYIVQNQIGLIDINDPKLLPVLKRLKDASDQISEDEPAALTQEILNLVDSIDLEPLKNEDINKYYKAKLKQDTVSRLMKMRLKILTTHEIDIMPSTVTNKSEAVFNEYNRSLTNIPTYSSAVFKQNAFKTHTEFIDPLVDELKASILAAASTITNIRTATDQHTETPSMPKLQAKKKTWKVENRQTDKAPQPTIAEAVSNTESILDINTPLKEITQEMPDQWKAVQRLCEITNWSNVMSRIKLPIFKSFQGENAQDWLNRFKQGEAKPAEIKLVLNALSTELNTIVTDDQIELSNPSDKQHLKNIITKMLKFNPGSNSDQYYQLLFNDIFNI